MKIDLRFCHPDAFSIQIDRQLVESKPAPASAGKSRSARNDWQFLGREPHKPAQRGINGERIITENQPVSLSRQRLQRAVAFAADQSIHDAEVLALRCLM